MTEKEKKKPKGKYVYVKDNDGVLYICKSEDLKRADEISEEEKAQCMIPPGDG